MKEPKILSLFDWISCTQIALKNLWYDRYTYLASEIEKRLISLTQKRFPKTIQIWDVTKLDYMWYMHRWTYTQDLDMICWWSPCQWFSFSWKQLNFKDERSALFFEFERIVKELKPKFFILENVFMKKQYQNVITEKLFWITPICINSQHVSPWLRKRLYWVWFRKDDGSYEKVEIENLTGPGPSIKSILEKNVSQERYLTDEQIEQAKIKCQWKTFKTWTSCWWVPLYREEKAMCITKVEFWKTNRQTNRVKDDKWIRTLTITEKERIMTLPDGYTEWYPEYIRQEMIWNGMTVKIMEYLLKNTIWSN